MLRFLSSFTATIAIAVLVVVVFFPPENNPATDVSVKSDPDKTRSGPEGNFTTVTLSHNFQLKAQKHEYSPPANISQKHTFTDPNHSAKTRVWHGLSPGGFGPHPALILLHGSNRTGNAMIDMWREIARKKGIVLIAPDAHDQRNWTLKNDGPTFMSALIQASSNKYDIDKDQIYVMGHSAGGLFVQQLAGEDNPPWKAMASHGAATPLKSLRRSNTPVPLYLFTGEKDHLFPPDSMERASKLLASAGHDVAWYNIPGHTHWYYEIGPQLAPLIWQQLTSGVN